MKALQALQNKIGLIYLIKGLHYKADRDYWGMAGGGLGAASRLRGLGKSIRITLVERGEFISYASFVKRIREYYDYLLIATG